MTPAIVVRWALAISGTLSRNWIRLVCFLSLGTAVWSLRFALIPAGVWFAVDDGIAGVVRSVPFQALTHMLVAPIALAIGPLQLMPGLRARQPALHRWLGRTYVMATLIAGVAGLLAAFSASGGPVASIGFGTLAVVWIVTTLRAWRAAVARDFVRHRLLMLYSFAMTFGAVTLRMQIPIGFIAFGFKSYSAMSTILAFSSWIPNVILVWLYLRLSKRLSARTGR